MKTDFTSLLAHHVSERPHATVFYDVDKPISYLQLSDEVDRIAQLLVAQGAKPGDRLALWLPTCTEWLTVFFACARIGMTVIALNTRFRSHEVADILSRGGCQWLVMWPNFKDLAFDKILQDVDHDLLVSLKGIIVTGGMPTDCALPGIQYIDLHEESASSLKQEIQAADGSAEALVYTTSGTTSLPKLVLHDQQSLLAHGYSVASRFDMKSDDVLLLGAPLCGAFGFSGALGVFAAGAAMVSSPVLNPAECAQQIRQFKVTHTFANNELLSHVLDNAAQDNNANSVPFPSLRLAGFASFAPSLGVFPERAERMGMRLVGLYGSSELQALVASQDADAPLEQRQLPGGRLTSATAKVRARDSETGQVLPHGEIGEIEIKAPSLMKQYIDNDQATAEVIDAEGYFRTGDLGHTINEQAFIFHARSGDFLRIGGFLVNPEEIQTYIESLTGVQSCQVVGAVKKDKTVPVAFVIAKPGHSLQESQIMAACRSELAGFKVPALVHLVEAFPIVESANSNKIQRGELQKTAQRLIEEIH